MDIYLHDVNKIKVDEISKLTQGDDGKTHTRKIFIETDRGENIKITCFGESKEKLESETQRVERI